MPDTPQFVSPTDLDDVLSSLQTLPGRPGDGFFGPQSITWQLNRECAVFLGAGRAALLQLAHPWVAAALGHHSNLLHDAIGRFHSTFRVVYTMLFGTRAQATAASRQLYRRHTGIRGELPSAIGSHPAQEHYEANEVAALRWVYATLVDSALLAYEFVLPPLSRAQRELYYDESKRMAALCGIPPEALPRDWNSFAAYMAAMLASPELGVETGRAADAAAGGAALGRSVLAGVGTSVRPPRWYRALTAYWLPTRFHAAFGLSLGERELRSLRRAARWLPRLYPHLPEALRFVGPYHEAKARLRGRPPGVFTQRNNLFWMGQPRLLYPELALPAGIAEQPALMRLSPP